VCRAVATVELDVVLRPGDDPAWVAANRLRPAVEAAKAIGAPAARWWVEATTDQHVTAAERAGLEPVRRLHQMRRALPLDETTDLVTRPFRPGGDDEAWLAVNNRAFVWHPDQGGWDAGTLRGRLAEPWFDPEGFLLHEADGRLAGFCWTKVHDDQEPALGEIYVIAVDPDFAGRGLGRALTVAGLAHLAERGLTVGMLYVEADNTPAVALYESLGFTVHHTTTAFETTF
jgi:mycothiol synthase